MLLSRDPGNVHFVRDSKTGSKRTGALIVAAVKLVSALISLLLAFIRANANGPVLFVIRFLYSIVDIWFCVALLSGVHTKRIKLIFAWLTWAGLHIFFFVLTIPILVIYANNNVSDKLKSENVSTVVFVIIITTCLHSFLTCVVYNYYKELKQEMEEMERENSDFQHDSSYFPQQQRNHITTLSETVQ